MQVDTVNAGKGAGWGGLEVGGRKGSRMNRKTKYKMINMEIKKRVSPARGCDLTLMRKHSLGFYLCALLRCAASLSVCMCN